MRLKSIICLVLISFCSSVFTQEAKDKKDFKEKIHLIFFSELFNENSKIIEFKSFRGEIPAGCKTEPNTKEAKICDALKQFAKENNITTIIKGEELKRFDEQCYYLCACINPDDFINATETFIKFYNAHFVKKRN